MSAKIFLTINAVLAILYGLGFVLVPASSLAVYGVAPDPHVILSTQFFGSALLGIGVVFWFAKDFPDQGLPNKTVYGPPPRPYPTLHPQRTPPVALYGPPPSPYPTLDPQRPPPPAPVYGPPPRNPLD